MPNSKVIDGRLHVQDSNGVYKRMPISYDEANSAKNPNVPDVMKNDGNVLLKVITKGERTEDGKSIKCKLPVEIGGERKMIGLDLDADKMDTTRETQKNNAYFNLDAHDRLVASVKDKDGSVDKVEFTVGRIAELNNEAWKSYTAEKIADTVPYTDKSVDMSKYPETQAMLNSKWDRQPHEKIADTVSYYESDEFLASQAELAEFAERYPDKYPTRHNVDAALGLPYESDESQSDGAEFE